MHYFVVKIMTTMTEMNSCFVCKSNTVTVCSVNAMVHTAASRH